MLIRPATTEDLEALLCLQASCVEAPQWTAEQWRGVLGSAFVAEADGVLAGFVVARCVADVGEIESIAVDPTMRRRGVGWELCEAALKWAREHGAEEMQLEVRASNAGAIALYAAMGFMEQGRRRGYYEHPKEDAVLMARALTARSYPVVQPKV